MQTGGRKRRRLLTEQDAVGRQREVSQRRLGGEQTDERRQVMAQQRFAAGQTDAVNAEHAEAVDQRADLLELEDVAARQPDVVFLRHAILAAQVASVGHRNAQVAQRPPEGVAHGGHAAQSMPGSRWARKTRRSDMPVVIETIVSEVLSGNPLGDNRARRVPIYLPPEYERSEVGYPVVYFLAGFSNGGVYLLGESAWAETLPQRVDRLVNNGAIRPMIVVMPDCVTRFGGSQYINSSATGRYADHLVDELVPFVDARYRTLADRDHRVVMGKSSGGYGA